jgi:hypothetical protein
MKLEKPVSWSNLLFYFVTAGQLSPLMRQKIDFYDNLFHALFK